MPGAGISKSWFQEILRISEIRRSDVGVKPTLIDVIWGSAF
jgi:hypothetical protein